MIAGIASVASAQNFVYGLSQGSAGGNVEFVHVDTATGALVNFANVGSIAGNVNGLASVLGTSQFYFASGTKFYGYNHAAPVGSRLTTFSGTMAATVDDGAWYNGKYYWIQGSKLYSLTPNLGNGTFTQTTVKTFASNFGTFGDITFNTTGTNAGDGTMYISSGTGVHKYNVNTDDFTTLNNTAGQQMQLGFAANGSLYGIFSGQSTSVQEQVYQINLTTGVRTLVSTVGAGASVYIRDAATAPTPPVPEPASMAALAVGLAALRRRRQNRK